MMLFDCCRLTGMRTQNGMVTVGSNETTPVTLRPDSFLGEFTKATESQICATPPVSAPSKHWHPFISQRVNLKTLTKTLFIF